MDTAAPSVGQIDADRVAKATSGLDAKTEDKKLRAASADFEAIFVGMLMDSMRKAFPKNPMFHGGQGEEVFQGLLDEQYSKKISAHGKGLGIGEMVYKALRRPDAAVDKKA